MTADFWQETTWSTQEVGWPRCLIRGSMKWEVGGLGEELGGSDCFGTWVFDVWFPGQQNFNHLLFIIGWFLGGMTLISLPKRLLGCVEHRRGFVLQFGRKEVSRVAGALKDHFCGGGCVKGNLRSKAREPLWAAPLFTRGCWGYVVLGWNLSILCEQICCWAPLAVKMSGFSCWCLLPTLPLFLLLPWPCAAQNGSEIMIPLRE